MQGSFHFIFSFIFLLVASQRDNRPISNEFVITPYLNAREAQEVKNPISVGTFSDARLRSAQEEIIVIYISGAKGKPGQPEPLSARKYAEGLVDGFKNEEFTDFPTKIAVFYQETGKERQTTAAVIINGKTYSTPKGNGVFTPRQIGANVDLFTLKYWKERN